MQLLPSEDAKKYGIVNNIIKINNVNCQSRARRAQKERGKTTRPREKKRAVVGNNILILMKIVRSTVLGSV
jgi:hypothetical protein